MAPAGPAFAASREQILEHCRQAMMPQIQPCARAKGLRDDVAASKQQCGSPLVRPCMLREEQKQAAAEFGFQ